MIFGIVGLCTAPGFLFGVAGVVLGHVAMSDINRTEKRGKGMAITGLIVGYAALLLGAAWWIAISVGKV